MEEANCTVYIYVIWIGWGKTSNFIYFFNKSFMTFLGTTTNQVLVFSLFGGFSYLFFVCLFCWNMNKPEKKVT